MGRRIRRDQTIRGRVVRMLALPLAVMLVLLAVIYVNEIARYRNAAATEHRITVILALQTLVQELQNERGLTVAVIGGNTGFRARIAPARERVDKQRTAVRTALNGDDSASLTELDGLPRIRNSADAGTAGRGDTFDFYTGLIEKL